MLKFERAFFKHILVITTLIFLAFAVIFLHVNATGLQWSEVNIGSGNGLVPTGNNPFREQMLTQNACIWRIMASLGSSELTNTWGQWFGFVKMFSY